MSLQATYESHKLIFKFEAGTSRGVLKEKQTYLLTIQDRHQQNCVGIGEAGPLAGLSVDDHPDFEKWLQAACHQLGKFELPRSQTEVQEILNELDPQAPAIRFAVESALLDLHEGGQQLLFPGGFTQGHQGIPINGLIWMGSKDFMKQQIDQKLDEGYSCLKLKIGALDFEEECSILHYIRTRYPQKLILRVDANGAFQPQEAMKKLHQLARYKLHSIEQPVSRGQWDLLNDLCRNSPVPIALDEELIGLKDLDSKNELMAAIRPQYLVLKPTLLGGFMQTKQWIELAQDQNVGWWITSALESNIGLNAIAQFTASQVYEGHQGLGTGQLFTNNLPTKLYIEQGHLYCHP